MVRVEVIYEGDLHCRAVHGPSGGEIGTDAPVDNEGRGEAFSPTDLVGTALATCVLTILGIVARRHGVDVTGATATVEKHMAEAPRRIARLPVVLRVPGEVPDDLRKLFERAVEACPVKRSLHPDVDATITFEWGA